MNAAEVDAPLRQTAGTSPFAPKYQRDWKCHTAVDPFGGSAVGSLGFFPLGNQPPVVCGFTTTLFASARPVCSSTKSALISLSIFPYL